MNRRGFSLTEILVTLVIIGATVTPVFMMLRQGNQTMIHARDLGQSVSLAGSLLAALRSQPLNGLKPVENEEIDAPPAASRLQQLSIARAPAGFRRILTLKELSDREGNTLVAATIQVFWQGRGTTTQLEYRQDALLSGDSR